MAGMSSNSTTAGAAALTPAASWSPAAVVWGLLAVVLVVFVLGSAAIALGADPEDRAVDLTLQASLAIGLVGVSVSVATRHAPLRDALAQLGLRRFRVARGVGLMLAAYGVFFGVLVAYGLLVRPDPQETVQAIAGEEDTLALVVLGVLVIGAAPLSEEVFFRGFFFGGLRGRLGFRGAALISAILFGLVHLPSGPAQVPPLAMFGLVLAWLYERTGSLGPPILMHALQNAIAFSYTVSA